MAGVWIVAFCSVFALLPNFTLADEIHIQYVTDTTTDERLAKIEAVLESVLVSNAALERKNRALELRSESFERKNRELELRIESLEKENRRLNDDQVSTPAEADVAEESATGEVDDDESSVTQGEQVRQPTLLNTQKRAGRNAPRALLSGSDTVAFTAEISIPRIENLGAGQTIKYDHVITNEGGGYHDGTGIFTAPVSGVYVFNIDTMIESGDSEYLWLMVNGQAMMTTFTHGAGETHLMTSSRTTILRVNAGSEVWVSTLNKAWHGDGRIHGSNLSSFSAWLVGHPNDVLAVVNG